MSKTRTSEFVWSLFTVTVAFLGVSVFTSNCGSPAGFDTRMESQGYAYPKECYPGLGATGSPKTIEQVVVLINSLPKPTTLECFLQSLDRPLNVYASSSTSSAQPAEGEESPRFFIFIDKLVLSVIPDGIGKNMLELSYMVSSSKSQKGELVFPITGPISPTLPYERILESAPFRGEKTTCGLCHMNETPGAAPNSYISSVLRPQPVTAVAMSKLVSFHKSCDSRYEAYRCEIFSGLMDYGPVLWKEFPVQ